MTVNSILRTGRKLRRAVQSPVGRAAIGLGVALWPVVKRKLQHRGGAVQR